MSRCMSIIAGIVLAFAAVASADPVNVDSLIGVGWQKSMVLDLNAAQTAYSDSWTGGESGTVTWVSNLNAKLERRFTHKFNFKSTLKLSFGQTLTQDEDTKRWSKPKKSTDLIDWENIATFPMQLIVDPYAAIRLESQFLDASVAAKKRYLNPMRLTYSTGIARLIHKHNTDEVSTRLGVAVKQTLMNVVTDTLTLATTDSTLTDGGLESVTDAQLSIHNRLLYIGKLSIYKAFFFSQSDNVKGTEFENDWKAIDVNLENTLKLTVTKIIAVMFYNQILYDKQVSRKSRIKQTLGVGVTFTMW